MVEISVRVLREDANDGIFLVLLLQMLLVLVAEVVHWEKGEDQKEEVTPLWAHLPRGNLSWVGLSVPVVDTLMEPMAVVVNMELLKISEFVERVMLQIVDL